MNYFYCQILVVALALCADSCFGQLVQCRYISDKGYSCNGFRPQTYFYFHVASRTCQPFTYYGCGGNANRFMTANDCNRVCKSTDVIRPGAPIGQGTNNNSNNNNNNNSIGNGARPGNTNNGSPIGNGTYGSNGRPPIGSGTGSSFMNSGFSQNNNANSNVENGAQPFATQIGGGTSNPNNIGSGTVSNGQPQPIGTGANNQFISSQMNSRPFNPAMAQNNNQMPQNGPLIGGQRPLPPNMGLGPMINQPMSSTMNPANMETTTKVFINGYAQMCNPAFAVVIDRPTVCGVNDACPIGFVCAGDYCCPSKQTVCRQKYDSGKELAGKELDHIGRYAFDPSSQQCSKFSYFGTEGNFNNFKTYNDCMQYCITA